MAEQLFNNYSSTLASNYTAGSGTMTVTSASGLPATTGTYTLAVRDATTKAVKLLFRVSSISGAVLTGAAEGTDVNCNTGDLVDGACLSVAAITQIQADSRKYDILSDNKAILGGGQGYAKGKSVTVASSATTTLLNYTGSGYVSSQWFAVANLPAGHSGDVIITVTVDGNVIYNDTLSAYMGAVYWTDSVQQPFTNKWIMMGGNHQSGLNRIPIPFGSSVLITLTNNYSGSITLWYDIAYKTGVPLSSWTRTKVLHVAANTEATGGLALTQDQVGTLLNVSGLNPGRLLGIYMVTDGYGVTGGTQQSFLEGAIDIYTDGVLTYRSSGTEDYFTPSNYFADVPLPYGNDDMSLTLRRTGSGQYLYGAMRFHGLDPITFDSALKIQWHAGDSSGSGLSFTGTVHLMFVVWYYTDAGRL